MSFDVIGIDLGTTNCAVATIDDSGELVMVRNSTGAELTPSVVYFEEDGSVLVGEEARQAAAFGPDNGVALIKRQMGTDFPIQIRGVVHTPESISALILKYLASSPQLSTGRRRRAVITVPAYFGLAEKEATHEAGRIAGLDVLELLAEPVAAAASYGLSAGRQATVLVFDLGGGTFDTTVLRLTADVNVVATDGHHELGGADVNRRLLSLVLDRLYEMLPAEMVDDLSDDEVFLGAVSLEVEAAKRDLSTRTTRDLVLRAPSGPVHVKITRANLENACSDLLDATEAIVHRLLQTAKEKGVARVDEVVMVGGSSRLPGLMDRLERMLGVPPRLVEPDLAVAKGAALRAHQLAGTSQLRRLTSLAHGQGRAPATRLIPVVPKSVGILVEDSFNPSGERTFVEHIVAANTPLPVTRVEDRFGTIVDNQETVRVQVYEQAGATASEDVGDNRRVLDGELAGLPPLRAGSVIRITFVIETDGRLTVVAHEPRSGRELTLEAFVEGVVDSADSKRLTALVDATTVRG